MATLIELELAQGRGTALINPDHIVSVTEEITLETGDPTTRVVLNIYSQIAQATGNAPFILVEETPAQVLAKMDAAAGPTAPTTPTTPTTTVDPNTPIGSIGQIVLWRLPAGKVISDLFNPTGFGVDPIVQGWAICNGQNGTTDLRGRVPVGWNPDDTDFDPLGKEGGDKTHTLTSNQQGTFTVATYGDDGDAQVASRISVQTIRFNGNSVDPANTNWGSDLTVSLSNAGSSHPNLQPYKVGLFIQRISGANVIATGTATTTTSSDPNLATISYVDSAVANLASPIKVKAFGNIVIGDIPDTNPEYTVSLGMTLPNNNYIVMVTPVSVTPASAGGDNNVTTPVVLDKQTTSFKITVDSGALEQNLSFDWVVYQA